MNNNTGNFTPTELSKHFPHEFFTTVTILVDSLPKSESGIVDSFHQALKLIAPLFIDPRPVVIVFGTSPFTIQSESSISKIETINGTEHFTGGDRIFYDWEKLKNETQEFQIAVMLEELCHHFFNILDEKLVRIVVCSIFNKVKWNGNEYEKI